MKTVLITGSNRGIGLEFVKQYAENHYQVIAACRDPKSAKELNELAQSLPNIEVMPLDVINPEHIKHLQEKLANKKLDILINNAGIYDEHAQKIGNLAVKELLHVIEVNGIAPIKILEACLPALERGEQKTVANITSKMGSIDDNQSGGSYGYRSSKVVLNMLTKSAAIDLVDKKIKVFALHPGWVKTDMGGENALINPEESVKGLRHLIDTFSLKESGGFYDFRGNAILW